MYCLLPVPGPLTAHEGDLLRRWHDGLYLNCGPECGGVQASVSFLPVAGIIIQSGARVPPGAPTNVTATVPIPGGDTDAIQTAKSFVPRGPAIATRRLLRRLPSILDTSTKQVTGAYSISDGTHLKMLFADDNTLWIGSLLCTQGERYHQGATTNLGCLTMFNTASNSVTMIDSYKGDATGIAAVTSLIRSIPPKVGRSISTTPPMAHRWTTRR